MLLSFPFQGYALFSIVFSTLFLIASYWFSAFFIKNAPNSIKNTKAYTCIKASLWFMVGSSLGPWALGAIMNILGPESIWYRLAIYFYLHFQYNGWMLLALAGLLFYILEQQQIIVSHRTFRNFFLTTVIGIVLSFFLSTLWIGPALIYYILGGLGAFLQLIGFGILMKICYDKKSVLQSVLSNFQFGILKLGAVLLLVKMILQLLTALPYFANLASTVLDFTIGYLHWTFLGVITFGLFFFLQFFGMIKLYKSSYIFYLMGFAITEVLIFYKGTAAWLGWALFEGYLKLLAIGSFLIPIALILILWQSKGGREKSGI